MPDNDWDDDDTQVNDSALVKRLRAEIKARDTALAERDAKIKDSDTELGTLRPQVRAQSVTDILAGLKVSSASKIARLVPQDVEANADAVKKWLDEYGDVFGVTASTAGAEATEGEGKPTEPVVTAGGAPQPPMGQASIDPAVQAAWQRVQQQQNTALSISPDIESQQIQALQSAFKAADGSSDKFLSILSGETPVPGMAP